jgi:hypothetical protein
MVFLKSFVAGLVGLAGHLVLLGAALWYGPMLWLHWQMWRASAQSGGGGAGFVFAVGPLLLIPGAAFWWEWRSAARSARRPRVPGVSISTLWNDSLSLRTRQRKKLQDYLDGR